jgi:hypothetical protein
MDGDAPSVGLADTEDSGDGVTVADELLTGDVGAIVVFTGDSGAGVPVPKTLINSSSVIQREPTHNSFDCTVSAFTLPCPNSIPRILLNQLRMVAKSPSGCGASGKVGMAGAQYEVFTKVSTVGPEESSNAIPMVIPAEVAF